MFMENYTLGLSLRDYSQHFYFACDQEAQAWYFRTEWHSYTHKQTRHILWLDDLIT